MIFPERLQYRAVFRPGFIKLVGYAWPLSSQQLQLYSTLRTAAADPDAVSAANNV